MNKAYAILRHLPFRHYICSRFILTIALQMQATAVAWQVFQLTNDALSLGLVGLAEVIPAIGFAMIGGYCVDHYERKPMVLFSLLLQLLVSISLLTLTYFSDRFQSMSIVYGIYGSIFMSGIARAFLGPGYFALFGEIVPSSEVVRASAWNTTIWQIAASVGPAIGGLVYGYINAKAVYGLSFSCIALAIFFILLIPTVPLVIEKSGIKEPFLKSLTVGLHFVFKNKLILSALSLDLLAVLFGGAVALFPIFADLLQIGSEGLGWMRAAPSIGAFLMALFLTHRLPNRHAGGILLAAVAGFGLCMIAFALSRNFYLTLFILGLSGALDAVSVMTRGVIMQMTTPSHMRGRVSAVNRIFISSSNELGAFESGVTAKWLGVVPSVVVGGSITLIVVGAIAFLSKPLRKLHFDDLKA